MRSNENRDLVFVLGAGKTGTTSLCGLLNCHPDVFVLCEVLLTSSQISRYGNKLLRKHPELLPCFFRAAGADKLANYRRAHEILRANGFAKSYFGDKMVGINSNYADDFKDCRVVYTVRRLPEWIAKDSVSEWYPLDANVVPFAVQYAKHFVESFLLPRVHHVRMETFLEQNAKVVTDTWRFLELDPPARAETWWETVGYYPQGDPKRAVTWWRGHSSSAVAPRENDTKFEIRENPFWSEILPIFNKYYDSIDRNFDRAEIEADLGHLQCMIDRHQQRFEDCFEHATSMSRNDRFKEERRRRKKLEKRAREGGRNGVARILRAIGLG